MSAARPARPAVDCHGARTAHPDPACEPIGQGWVKVALHIGHHVEHGLILPQRDRENLVVAGLRAAPEGNLEFGCHGAGASRSSGGLSVTKTPSASSRRDGFAFRLTHPTGFVARME